MDRTGGGECRAIGDKPFHYLPAEPAGHRERNWSEISNDLSHRLGEGGYIGKLDCDRLYSTYKVGLVLLAGSHLSPPAKPPPGTLDNLLALQDDSGGWSWIPASNVRPTHRFYLRHRMVISCHHFSLELNDHAALGR